MALANCVAMHKACLAMGEDANCDQDDYMNAIHDCDDANSILMGEHGPTILKALERAK